MQHVFMNKSIQESFSHKQPFNMLDASVFPNSPDFFVNLLEYKNIIYNLNQV